MNAINSYSPMLQTKNMDLLSVRWNKICPWSQESLFDYSICLGMFHTIKYQLVSIDQAC